MIVVCEGASSAMCGTNHCLLPLLLPPPSVVIYLLLLLLRSSSVAVVDDPRHMAIIAPIQDSGQTDSETNSEKEGVVRSAAEKSEFVCTLLLFGIRFIHSFTALLRRDVGPLSPILQSYLILGGSPPRPMSS